MKTIEEKAQAYDRAVEEISKLRDVLLKEGIIGEYGIINTSFERIFPELKESEDERMLREIKRYIKEQGDKPTGLPNGNVAVADMLAWLEKQEEKKEKGNERKIPIAEWSEDDNMIRNSCINHIEEELVKARNDESINAEQKYYIQECCIERINWLKSIKPWKGWKPSNEQMEALKDAVEEWDGYKEYKTLNSLYEDLQKL